MEILNEFLYQKGDAIQCEDSTDYRPAVSPGEVLTVVRRLPDRALVKRLGSTGWYFGRLGPDLPPQARLFSEKDA